MKGCRHQCGVAGKADLENEPAADWSISAVFDIRTHGSRR